MGDRGSDFTGYHLDQNREGTGGFQCFGAVYQALCIVTSALHTIAAQLMFHLWCEADVCHDGDARASELFDVWQQLNPAFEFDGMGTGFLHESNGGMQALFR